MFGDGTGSRNEAQRILSQTTIPGNYAHHDPSARAKHGPESRLETDKRTATITCFRQHRRRTDDIMLIREWMGG